MIVFHIGIHKTGSSTLQALMAANVARLAGRGIVFPILGDRVRPHHALAHEIGQGEDGEGPYRDSLMRQLISRGLGERLVLSSEAFSHVDPAMVRAAIGCAAVRVIAYLREPCAWLCSHYTQRANTGTVVEDFDVFFQEVIALERKRGAGIVAWAQVFGGENLRVRSVAPDTLVNGDLVDDFLSALGTTREGLIVPPARNVSPDWRVVELLRARHAAAQAEAGRVLGKRDPVSVAIRTCGEAAGEELGWSTRADYMTRAQRVRFVEECRPVDAAIRAAVEDCLIEETDVAVEGDRDFLPTAALVPAQDRLAFEAAFAVQKAARLTKEAQRRNREARISWPGTR